MSDDSTLSDVISARGDRRGMVGRRLAVGAMLVVVLAGATGFLGVRARTVSDVGDSGYRLSLTYPRIARSGLDIPWELRLVHPGGFSDDIVVAVSANYFDIFEFQGMHPEPSAETADGDYVYLTFDAPKGETFTTTLDTYVQPASQVGRDAKTAVFIGGRKVAQVSYSTWLVP